MNFKLSAVVTISIYTNVEAETIEEAIAEASRRPIERYEWGTPNQENEVWVSEDFDGEPYNIKQL